MSALNPKFSAGHSRFLISISLFIVLGPKVSFSQQFSDTLQIKTVEIHANKVIKEEAGKTITKIDSMVMIRSLTANLAELISQNTPIFIKEYGRGAMATASFRGTAPSHTQVLWNGISLNSPMLGMVDFSTIPVYFTDNISLLHGSGSLSEKSGALGGVVKLENTTNWQNKFSGRVLTGIGSYGTKDEFIQVSAGNRKIQSQTRAFYNYSDNDFQFVNKLKEDIDYETGHHSYPTERNENAQYTNYGLLQEFYLHTAEKSILTARYWFQHNDRSLPQLLTNESGNSTSSENASQTNINRQTENAQRTVAEWKVYGRNGKLELKTGTNIQLLNYRLTTKVSGAGDHVIIDSRSQSTTGFFNAGYTYQFSDYFSVVAGANAGFSKVSSYNSPKDDEAQGYDRQRSDHSLHVQINKSFGKKLIANLLLREEIIDGKPTPFIPSAGLEFHPLDDKGFLIKGNLARNYHQPTLNDLYYIPGGNPDLKAESGIMADLGSSYTGVAGVVKFHASLNGYYSRIKNWIIWLPSARGFWEPYNMNKVNASGIEINTGFNAKLNKLNCHFNGNYALTRSINRDNPMGWADGSFGQQLPYIPRHSANILSDITFSGYHFSWHWNYYSQRFTTTSNDKTTKRDWLYPYFMSNIYLGKEIRLKKQKLELEMKIFNLLNEEYRTVLQRAMPRRNYSLLLRFEF